MNRTLAALSVSVVASLSACGGGGSSEPQLVTDQAQTAVASASDARMEALTAAQPLTDAPAALNGNVVCTHWRIGAAVLDNLEVPAGAACQLNRTTVRGSIKMHHGAMLDVNAARVAGTVESVGGAYLVLRDDTRVSGNLVLDGVGLLDMRISAVTGNLMATAMTGALLVSASTVGGNMQLDNNLGGGEITDSRILGNLQCSGNRPAPKLTNTTAASMQGDCAGGGTSGTSGTSTPPPAFSGNVTCVGQYIGGVTLDSLIVPAGATCTLHGTRLTGNIELRAGSSLLATDVAAAGNLVADGAAKLTLGGASTVGGSVQLQRGAGANVVGAQITGNVQIDGMLGTVVASGNRIGGSLQAMSNRASLVFMSNRITGVMQCKGNLPLPMGNANVATEKQDECMGL